MSKRAGAPLLFLWRAKLVGRGRDLRRRLGTPVGALTLLVGVVLVGGWVASVFLRSTLLERTGDPPSPESIRLGLLGYLVFVTVSSVSVRGLYLPRPEIDRLFSAPLARATIVRYRLATAILASLPFVLLVAVFLSARFASPRTATVALLATVPAMTIFGQGVSLLVAPTTGAVDRLLRRVPDTALRLLGVLGILGIFLYLGLGPGLESEAERMHRTIAEEFMAERRGGGIGVGLGGGAEPPGPGRFESVAQHPVVRALTTPLHPWAVALGAPGLRSAAPWLALVLALSCALFELVARLPIDFRMSTLRTSEAFEKRIARVRRGQGGALALGESRGVRVPWLFGRSPFGALLWLRLAWLLRRSRGTLVVAGLVALGGLVVGTRVMVHAGAETATLAVLGVVYLSSGLRVDFRADLDRLETMKAWPVRPSTAFVAAVLPGVLLTALVVGSVLVARAAILGLFSPELGWILLGLLPVAYAWAAVDNAIFLLFPVRFAPGQGSAVQNAGRGFLLILLRGALLLTFLFVGGGGAIALEAWLAPTHPGLAGPAAVLWAVVVGAAGLYLLTAFGAWAFRRYDVSRVPPGH